MCKGWPLIVYHFYLQDKVRNFFLVETSNEETVLRTKRCLFAVTEEEVLERRQREAEEDGESFFLQGTRVCPSSA
jgi:hypothetical protein